jgi:uncharacterized protein DUF6220
MFTRAMRWTYAVFAWLFVAAVVVQFFFAGLFIFHVGSEDLHAALGYSLFLAAILYTLFAFAARVPWSATGWTALLIVLVALQPTLAFAPVPLLHPLHPVNALAIFTLAAYLALRSRRHLSAAPATPAPAAREFSDVSA